jgi:hypothetical protein
MHHSKRLLNAYSITWSARVSSVGIPIISGSTRKEFCDRSEVPR